MSLFNDPDGERKLAAYQASEAEKHAKLQQKTNQFIQLRCDGKSLRECAAAMAMSLGSMSEWNRQFAHTIQALRMEATAQKYQLTLDDQLANHHALLTKIRQAMAAQDFTQLSTRDLFSMMTLLEQQQQEQINTNFH
jgi:hypothetical protein